MRPWATGASTDAPPRRPAPRSPWRPARTSTAYENGDLFLFRSPVTTTLGFALGVDSLGARSVRMLNRQGDSDAAPSAGLLVSGFDYFAVYSDARDDFYIIPTVFGSCASKNTGNREFEIPDLGPGGIFETGRLPQLSQANAEDGTSATAGLASGERIAQAIAAHQITTDLTGKADVDLQNISDSLSDTEQGTVRTRIAAQADLDVVPQAEAEAGSATTERVWTAERVGQAVASLASGSGLTQAEVEIPASRIPRLGLGRGGRTPTSSKHRVEPRRLTTTEQGGILKPRSIGAQTEAGGRHAGWAEAGNTDPVPRAKLPDARHAGRGRGRHRHRAPDVDAGARRTGRRRALRHRPGCCLVERRPRTIPRPS